MLSGAFSEIKHTPRWPQMRQLIKLADKERALEKQHKRKWESDTGIESMGASGTEREWKTHKVSHVLHIH